MNRIFIAVSVFIFALTLMAGIGFAKKFANDPAGYWLSKKQDVVIHIDHCGGELCGKIHWIAKDEQQFDINNPDDDLRGRSMCGIDVLWGMKKSDSNPYHWKGGKIYKADDGEFFSANLSIEQSHILELRGYIGIPAVGKTSQFTRVESYDYPKCTPEAAIKESRPAPDKRLKPGSNLND